MKTFPLILAGALVAGIGTFAASAQDAAAPLPPQVERQGEAPQGRMHRAHHRGEGKGPRRGHHRRAMMRDMMERADANGDGAVTADELRAFRAAQVGAADANGDRALTLAEFETLYRENTRTPMVRAFQRLDRDGNGVVDAAEIDRPLDRMIERMDRDGDGTLEMRRGWR